MDVFEDLLRREKHRPRDVQPKVAPKLVAKTNRITRRTRRRHQRALGLAGLR